MCVQEVALPSFCLRCYSQGSCPLSNVIAAGVEQGTVPSQKFHICSTCLFSCTSRHYAPMTHSLLCRCATDESLWRAECQRPVLCYKRSIAGEGWGWEVEGRWLLDKQTPDPGQLFQIGRRKTNLLIKFAVQLEPCGIVAQTLPALCYTTHKVAELRQRVKESEGEKERG